MDVGKKFEKKFEIKTTGVDPDLETERREHGESLLFDLEMFMKEGKRFGQAVVGLMAEAGVKPEALWSIENREFVRRLEAKRLFSDGGGGR